MNKQDIIINFISKKIELGEIKEGDLIPSENFLKNYFNFSRSTIRNSLMQMINVQLIYPIKGKGYVYKGNKNNLNSFKGKYGDKAQSIHIKTKQFHIFNEDLKTFNWYEIHKVRYYQDKPFIYTIQQFPTSLLSKIELDKAEKSLYKAFEEANIAIKFAKKKIKLIKTPEKIKKMFNITTDKIIFLESHSYLEDHSMIEKSSNYYLDDFEWEFLEHRFIKK